MRMTKQGFRWANCESNPGYQVPGRFERMQQFDHLMRRLEDWFWPSAPRLQPRHNAAEVSAPRTGNSHCPTRHWKGQRQQQR